jgi:hypothetical protein
VSVILKVNLIFIVLDLLYHQIESFYDFQFQLYIGDTPGQNKDHTNLPIAEFPILVNLLNVLQGFLLYLGR